MSRIKQCFSKLAQQKKKALIPYIVCGDPSIDSSLSIMHALVDAGADVIELGVPFSDPMAEGPVIQMAHERALNNNCFLENIFSVVSDFRKTNTNTPIVLMGYANPIEKMGYDSFSLKAKQAGVDGVLTVDMPYEEVSAFNDSLQRQDLDNIFLLTPTTSKARAQSICQYASGYLYYVSLKGVTGAGHLNITDVEDNYKRLSRYTDLPISVGFGIQDADSAKAIAQFATGVVIGSALINVLVEEQNNNGNVAQAAQHWLSNIRLAIDTE